MKTILLVDDDSAVRRMLSRLLVEEEYHVVTASSGVEAIELAKTGSVDIVLLDLNMPLKDGWETFERLTSENPLVPVVIITARSNQVFPALASGAGALMEKPLDLPSLLQTIRELLNEPVEVRKARINGKPAAFRYLPKKPDVVPSAAHGIKPAKA
jgi:CheY-like chemotaxis protein